ncbi:hypothetical protein BH11BAC5_BH11BAC5_50420 [soil metagenome]
MPENEFEKEVQQKIDGLKLKPNVEVWQNVSTAITKRKAGKRIFILIFLLLFFSTAGLFVIYNGTKQQEKSAIVTQENISVNVNVTKPSIKEDKLTKPVAAATDNGTIEKEKIGTGTLSTQKKAGEIITSTIQPKVPLPQAQGKSERAENKENFVNKDQPDIADVHHNGNPKIQYKKKQKLSTKVSKGSVENDENKNIAAAGKESEKVVVDPAPGVADSASENIVRSPVLNPIEENISSIKDTVVSLKKSTEKTNVVVKKSERLKQINTWKWGVNFSAGVATTSNGYLGIIGASNSDANKAYYSADQISGAGNSQASNAVYRPSKIRPGVGVTVGIFVQKNVSIKTAVSVGINYKTYNTTMAVGSQLDSIIPANNYLNLNSAAYTFYRTGASSNYKNHFRFIELPIAVNINLNKQHKRPVYLTTGIVIARLIGSNALQFDTASGKYYSNNNLLNKTQANISIGALFGLSKMVKNPVLIGPDISFGLNKIAKTNLYADRRYSYFGLRLQKNFGKK